jgi:putative transcriptional regulator
MSDKNKDWGHFDIVLGEYLTRNGISKNKIAAAANLQRSQLISYCKNEVQRPDLGVLARICCVLRCDLADIIKYCPPEEYPLTDIGLKETEDL